MSEPTEPSPSSSLIEREAIALTTLEQLAAERARAESETEKAFRARREEEERAYEAAKNRVTTLARTDTQETKGRYLAAREKARQTAETETKAVEAEYEEARKTIAVRARKAQAAAKKTQEEARWQALAVFEAGKDASIKQFKK